MEELSPSGCGGGARIPDFPPSSSAALGDLPFTPSPSSNGGVTVASSANPCLESSSSSSSVRSPEKRKSSSSSTAGAGTASSLGSGVGVGGGGGTILIAGSNKKERRRTQSINNAFANLRDCIPNVPCDTKLSKIKTLRLATSYIDYLMTMLNTENPSPFVEGFKADIHKKWNEKSEEEKRRELVRRNGHDETAAVSYVVAS